ncbi:MAG: hypothetical protein H5U02_05050 [Clostridia bacterium]|nr:hypothetical protein [Clostridia bacterium]
MALVKSPAGDMTLDIKGLERRGNNLVMIATLGMWDSEVYMPAEELWAVAKKAFKASILGFLITVPFRARGKGRS